MTNLLQKPKQLVVLSGKGGTGKTSVTAAFADLNKNSDDGLRCIMVDADVDAANLSLVLSPEESEVHEFWGGSLAEINQEACIGCGDCVSVCRYDAIFPDKDNPDVYWIDPIACDGCAACVYACPQNIIKMVKQQEGEWVRSQTATGLLFHADLFPGRENSGKLVTTIRQRAKLAAGIENSELIIIDGPPGTGCPVISACAGVDLGLIVTEPSMAGLHDLKRVLGVLQHFNVDALICINKTDLYPEGTYQIKQFATEKNINIVGEIPFDDHIPKAMVMANPVTSIFPECNAAIAIKQVWRNVLIHLREMN